MAKTPATKHEFDTFEDILDALEQLSREHLLVYRIGVGRVLLQSIFAGDAGAYASHDPRKEQRFTDFVTKCGAQLRRYGLGVKTARESIVCYIVYETLPAAVRASLFYSQVRELARLRDPTARARLAAAAVQGDWSVIELQDAVSCVKAGLPYDADPETPGIQPPDAPPPRELSAGRLVTRAERWTAELDEWSELWSQADASRLRKPQRERMAATVARAQERLAALAAVLGG